MITLSRMAGKNYNFSFNNQISENKNPENLKQASKIIENRHNLAFLSTKQFLVNFTGSPSYTKIDKENWRRKQHFDFFSACQNPFFSITAESDASKLIEVSKKKGIPTSQAILYMVGRTLNDIPEFSYRLKDNEVIKYDKVCMGMSIAREDGLFNFCNLDYLDNPKEFLDNAHIKMEEAKKRREILPNNELCEGLTYVSCLPWVNFTSVANPIGDYKTDSTPRITWGKYVKEGNKTTIPVAIEAHHGLMDGRHAGLFYEKLQENFNNADKIFEKV